MFSLRTHVIICASLFATLIGVAVLGNVLAAAGIIRTLHGTGQTVAVTLMLVLFVAAGMSAIPVMVKLVFGAQERLGNQDAPVIGAAIRGQAVIVWVIWALILTGLAVALPAMVADGFFGPVPQQWVRQAAGRMARGPHLGRLAARPDMPLAEAVRQSSLALDIRRPDTAIAAAGVFDFAIPGTSLVFPGARYYFITTYDHDHTRIAALNVGISRDKMTRADLEAADAEVRARLIADGWLAGHEVYRDEEDRALHGGAARGPEGRSWLKDAMVLDVESRRMDDEKPGEDPAAAGEWIQYVELWPAKAYPGIDRLAFAPATRQASSAP